MKALFDAWPLPQRAGPSSTPLAMKPRGAQDEARMWQAGSRRAPAQRYQSRPFKTAAVLLAESKGGGSAFRFVLRMSPQPEHCGAEGEKQRQRQRQILRLRRRMTEGAKDGKGAVATVSSRNVTKLERILAKVSEAPADTVDRL